MVRWNSLVCVFAAVAGAVQLDKISKKKAPAQLPGAYIFEFEQGRDTSSFRLQATEQGTTRMELDYELFKGVSMQFDDIENAEDLANKLAALPAIKNMWPVKLYSVPDVQIKSTGSSTQSVATKRAINETAEDTFAPHVMTQVDKLRAKGITGKGIKIAVIDTGIDYKHPALGGCFGSGCLVTQGTDLVGDDYDGYNAVNPDDDPMDCQGHGTHVAGIIAAQENSMGFTGAAPDVTLGAYRVFGCDGEAGNDVLIAAYNKAFEDGADIITASIGGASGWSEEPWSVAVSRIVEQGVPCPVSAGNSGDVGIFYASTAANGKKVTAIASYDNSDYMALLNVSYYTVGGNGSQIGFGSTAATPGAWDNVTLPLWAPNYDTTVVNGGCDAYPSDTPDLSGYIVLVRRGTCTFVQKAQNAANAGAKYIMIYNNAGGTANFDVSSVSGIVGAGMVSADVGAKWISYLKEGSTVTLDMGDGSDGEILEQSTNSVTGGAVSTYSSWGPTWEMDVKPQFGSPGGNILSTYPTKKGSYAVLSGTSMACPLVAAIIALVAQVRGTFDPETIENLLSANSNPQLFNGGSSYSSFLAPVPQQGGGLVQAYDAAYATALLSPSSLSFNDTDNFVQVLNFTLKNTGSENVEFDISHIPTVTTYTLGADSIYPDVFPNEFAESYATLNFSETKVSLGSGESVTIEVLPTAPQGVSTERLAVWSGYVAVNGSDGSSLSLPYQGLAGSLHDSTVLGSEDTWISKSTDSSLSPVASGSSFTLPAAGTASNSTATLPALVWYLALGSSKLHGNIVPVSGSNSTSKSIGEPTGFPLLWNPMGANSLDWTGELANGDFAPEGQYKIVFKALKIFGDESVEADWDESETPAFSIKYSS